MPIELAILKFFNVTIANPAFDLFFKYIGDFDIWRWPVALAIILLLWKGGPKGRWMVLLGVITVAIVDPSIHYIFKPLFARLRPCQEAALTWLRVIDGCGGKYGFPSSHAANLFGQAVIIGSFYGRSRYFFYPLAILVCVSRIYVGVHYFTDVLAGAALGTAVAVIVLFLTKQLAPQKVSKYLPSR
jgi:undecaprenyl-diphosphatase